MGFNYLLILLAIYIAAESLAPLFNMGAGFKGFCHKVKYVLVVGSSVMIAYKLWFNPTDVFLLAFVLLTLFFVVWPRMVFRLKCFGIIKGKYI